MKHDPDRGLVKPTFFWSTPMHCVLPQVRKICCMYMEISRHLVTANKLFFFPLNHKCIAMANGLSYFSAGDLGGSAERTTKSQRGNYWRLDYTLKKTLILLQYQLLCVLTVFLFASTAFIQELQKRST